MSLASETVRKQSGSYYTPADVGAFFWREFFSLRKISDAQIAADFIRKHHFVEPSAGAGALVFTLLHKLVSLDVAAPALERIDITIIDINKRALLFIQKQIESLEQLWGIRFHNVRFVRADFRALALDHHGKIPIYFGNPPFVSNPKGRSDWKNLFADFLDIALRDVGNKGSIQFILPLSVAFSRDYSRLRALLRARPSTVALSHFDNIPDTLFKSGKPQNENTNKANSQRCTILSITPSDRTKILSTELHRWSKQERGHFLSRKPKYYDVTPYALDDQFPRPVSADILRYICGSGGAIRLGDLCSAEGKYELHVAGVARNYIGIRETAGAGTNTLRFGNKDDLHAALLVLASDLYLAYWRTIGDGFHVTKENICGFPLPQEMPEILYADLPAIRKLWVNREQYRKTKLNSGRQTHSYDFSSAAPLLMPRIKQFS